MLVIHLAFSLLALAAILAILLLPKGRGAHRWLGRLAAAALALSALSSFGIQARGHLSWLHVLSVVTLVNLAWAVWAIRRGRVAVHRRAMLAGAGGLFVAGLFATFAPGRYLYGVFFG
ncbi:DUF2306 domain-containing protein [Sediminicoccus rosea]|uniref:DUF2306 domain-containing protein n=1 Tax=Sediminicoccus rosea TaxID=1225128 RepID=A0ABZ0PFR1_9PROT|nr:DUF2306 domain-containing protein [Sediminicoccus rosea]WPB84437.1 DUF2306 domain-containing protein [Sediminicoccus rosea]